MFCKNENIPFRSLNDNPSFYWRCYSFNGADTVLKRIAYKKTDEW